MDVTLTPLPPMPVALDGAAVPPRRDAAGTPGQVTAMPLEGAAPVVLSPDPAAAARVMLAALQAAAARHPGLAPLLADLAQALAVRNMPLEVRVAMQGVLQAAAPLQAATTDAAIVAALVRDDKTAATPGSPPVPDRLPAAQAAALTVAIKTAVLNLQQALAPLATAPSAAGTTPAPQSLPPGASPTRVAPDPVAVTVPGSQNLPPGPMSAAGVPAATLAPLPALVQANTLAAPQTPAPIQAPLPGGMQVAVPGTMPVDASAPQVVPTRPGQPESVNPPVTMPPGQPFLFVPVSPAPAGGATAGGDLADAMVSLLLLQQAAQVPGSAAARPRPVRAGHAAPQPGEAVPVPGTSATAQYRKVQGSPPAPTRMSWSTDADPALVARTLSERTGDALAQIRLLETAAQMLRPDDRPVPGVPDPRVAFELVFVGPHGSTRADVEVVRERARSRRGTHDVAWRARFSVDIEPLGPVHAQVTLMGSDAWVSLWAERESTMHLLDAQRTLLQERLGSDSLVAEVTCSHGVPVPREPARGQFVDSAI